VYLPGLMHELGLVASASDGRRMIDQGGVKIGGLALEPRVYTYARAQVENMVIQVGKRRYAQPIAAS
jgi:tyrosyl-tRNA synthetase